MARGGNRIDMIGKKFARLTVVSDEAPHVYPSGQTAAMVRCRCDCGREVVARAAALRSGNTQSCGCLKNEVAASANRSHGGRGTPEYSAWCNMRARCYSPGASGYDNYGGRGIRVCDRWSSFELFLADMGPKPTAGHSIERNDVDGDYTPENCRWATRTEQARNTRSNRRLTINGVTKTVAEWGETAKVATNTIYQRLYWGWSPERAVSEPDAGATTRFVAGSKSALTPEQHRAARLRSWVTRRAKGSSGELEETK